VERHRRGNAANSATDDADIKFLQFHLIQVSVSELVEPRLDAQESYAAHYRG
jgi:hypothetical protein